MKEKDKPNLAKPYNPYELHPPIQCYICGATLYDKRQTRIWLGKRCCRKCTKGEQDASYNNV